MRILLVHNFYQQYGGSDAMVEAEERLLRSRGEELRLYTRHNDELKRLSLGGRLGFVRDTFGSRRTAAEVSRAVHEFAPDVAYVHNVYPLISPSVYHALHRLGVPVVQAVHDFRLSLQCANGCFYIKGNVCERCKTGDHRDAVRNRCYRQSYVLSALYAGMLARAGRDGVLDKVATFLCLTEFQKRKLGERGIPEARLAVRPNWIDPSGVEPNPGRGDYVAYLGRLSPEKGVRTLLAAAARTPEIPYRIAGTGPLQEELAAAVRDRSLGNVELAGFQGPDAKWGFLAGARLVAIPSECYENFPVTALESFAAGKPVVAPGFGGLGDVVEHGRTGLHYRPGDAADLAARLRQLFADADAAARLGREARARVETVYGPERSYRTLVALFGRLAAAV